MNLPTVEWIPGNLALEYVKSELPDYSVENVEDLLMLEMFEANKIRYKIPEINMRSDEIPWPPVIKYIVLQRDSLLTWINSVKKRKQKNRPTNKRA